MEKQQKKLGLSYDLFTRTTTRNHYAVVQELFRVVQRNGYMIEQTTFGAISPKDESNDEPEEDADHDSRN